MSEILLELGIDSRLILL